MIANIVYERAETFRLAQTTVPAQNLKDPGKGFLTYIIYRVERLKSRAKLDFKQ